MQAVHILEVKDRDFMGLHPIDQNDLSEVLTYHQMTVQEWREVSEESREELEHAYLYGSGAITRADLEELLEELC